MNYHHYYHCGNFADIFKHCILSIILNYFSSLNNSKILAIDTHSGLGKYNLNHKKCNFLLSSQNSTKNNLKINNFEYLNGITQLLKHKNYATILPESFLKILTRINSINQKNSQEAIYLLAKNFLTEDVNFYYPGSPYIFKHFLNNKSKAIIFENNLATFLHLKKMFAGNQKFMLLQQDSFGFFNQINSILMQNSFNDNYQKIILIDPSFEKFHHKISPDYQNIVDFMISLKKINQLLTIIWYPIIHNQQFMHNWLYQKMLDIGFLRVENFVLNITKLNMDSNNILAEAGNQMTSCGIILINPLQNIVNQVREFEFKINNFYQENA